MNNNKRSRADWSAEETWTFLRLTFKNYEKGTKLPLSTLNDQVAAKLGNKDSKKVSSKRRNVKQGWKELSLDEVIAEVTDIAKDGSTISVS